MLEISENFDFSISRLYAEKLERKYPFLQCTVIGRSESGHGIFAFSLGKNENRALILSGEPSCACAALYRFIDKICESVLLSRELSGIDYSLLIKKFGLTVIPCLHPDSESRFGAPYEKSEERALISYCRRHGFRSCLEIKSGETDRILFRADVTPKQSPMMAKILASASPCPLSEERVKEGISSWFCGEFSRPSFILEENEDKNPEAFYLKAEEALVLFTVM